MSALAPVQTRVSDNEKPCSRFSKHQPNLVVPAAMRCTEQPLMVSRCCRSKNISRLDFLPKMSKRLAAKPLPSIKLIIGILAVTLCVQCHAHDFNEEALDTTSKMHRRLLFGAETFEKPEDKYARKRKSLWAFLKESNTFWLCVLFGLMILCAFFIPGKVEHNIFGFGGGANGAPAEDVGGSSLFLRLAVAIPAIAFIGIAGFHGGRRYLKMQEIDNYEEYVPFATGETGSTLIKRHSVTCSMVAWFVLILLMGIGALIVGAGENVAELADHDTAFLKTTMFIVTMASLLTVGGIGTLVSAKKLWNAHKAMNADATDGEGLVAGAKGPDYGNDARRRLQAMFQEALKPNRE